jgi:branched-chain amino acid transport system ATP-binding protein
MLEATGITVTFGGVRALDSADLSLAAGEVCGLLGPNGAGKTTLFDCLSGVRRPSAGRIRFGGEDITNRSPTWRARRGLRRTFQRQQTFGRLSVEENVLVATEWRGGGGGLVADLVRLPSRVRRERDRRHAVREVLSICGLEAVSDVPASRLPIGTARMVEVARALVDHPKVLMLDEPTSGLDEREEARVADVLCRARAETGCGVVLVEHDVDFVMSLSDRVVVLDRGKVIGDGTPAAIQADERVRAVYLGAGVA